MKNKTQTFLLLNYFLYVKEPITSLEALKAFGIFRLADVVYKLKNKGHKIKTNMVSQNGKRFASYEYIMLKLISLTLWNGRLAKDAAGAI